MATPPLPFPHQSCVQFYFLKNIPIACVSLGNVGFSFSGRLNVQFFCPMCQQMCKKHIKMHYQALPEGMGRGRGGCIEELSIKEYVKEYINMVIYIIEPNISEDMGRVAQQSFPLKPLTHSLTVCNQY